MILIALVLMMSGYLAALAVPHLGLSGGIWMGIYSGLVAFVGYVAFRSVLGWVFGILPVAVMLIAVSISGQPMRLESHVAVWGIYLTFAVVSCALTAAGCAELARQKETHNRPES